ncbi:uncharacterized protein LOC125478235 [Pyrus x bretschneideri]|uniref:uncharacterized protein LOC125478235 n=1 Tax=Pyrus x bretschneideri TaxID=225117 RepID=UPI00202E70E6|nr:uncharacterized protein LOC125478235 [Pyrus x bretschneideri]
MDFVMFCRIGLKCIGLNTTISSTVSSNSRGSKSNSNRVFIPFQICFDTHFSKLQYAMVMQNLFGDQSEEEEVDSEHESNPHPNSHRAVTRLYIVLLHALLSAETSTELIKEGSTILPKHFMTIRRKWLNYEQERVARANLQL